MKKFLLINILLLLMAPIPAYAQTTGTVTLTTYYAPPVGHYNRLLLFPQNSLPNPCTIGQMLVNNSDNLLYFCKDDGTGNGIWQSINSEIWQQSADNVFLVDRSTPKQKSVGIGTTTPWFKLNLYSDGGILAKGTFGSGATLKTTGAGTRFIWYPRKAAIRAGGVTGSQWDDANIGNYSAAFGKDSIASNTGSTVLGGESNTITSQYSFIGGGHLNLIDNPEIPSLPPDFSVIGGGYQNANKGKFSFIGGGRDNLINYQDHAVILGGSNNKIHPVLGTSNSNVSQWTAIGGGNNNVIYENSEASSIGGGDSNEIHGNHSSITGGQGNKILTSTLSATFNSSFSSIAGGQENQITGTHSSIIGGLKNEILNANFSSITGGELNKIEGSEQIIMVGGIPTNIASADYSHIGGGKNNKITQSQSTIIGGENNTVESDFSIIVGGKGNIIDSPFAHASAIVGGLNNRINGNHSFIGGGENNKIIINNDSYSVILGGLNNQVLKKHSFAAGRHMVVNGERSFVWGHADSDVEFNADDAFIIYSGKVGLSVSNPQEKFEINGGVKVDDGTIILTSAPNLTAAPVDLKRNPATGVVGKDIAETFETTEDVEIGDLLVMDLNEKRKLKKSSTSYDKKVVGVVTGAPAVVFKGREIVVSPKPDSLKNSKNPPVAVAGQVLCKVSLENGPIEAGDLLTSSSLAGHVMKATDLNKSFDTVVGKALESFNGNDGQQTGFITMLVITN